MSNILLSLEMPRNLHNIYLYRLPENSKKAKLGGLASKWNEQTTNPMDLDRIIADSEIFATKYGGISEDLWQVEERKATKGNGAMARKAAQASPGYI